jgi:uncharacterized membrane protein YphA (DoxX/SURF4 family)
MPEVVVALTRLVLGTVFLSAAFAKAIRPSRSREAFREFGVPSAVAGVAWPLVSLAELAAGVALMFAPLARFGAFGAMLLLAVFSAAVAFQLARGRAPSCPCFGELSARPIGRSTIVRNTILFGLAGLVLAFGPGLPISSMASRLAQAEEIASAPTLAAMATSIATATAMLSVLLWRQQGRLLLRIDALEVLAAGAPAPPSALTATNPAAPGIRQGESAPSFSLPDVNGTERSLTELLHGVRSLLLVFMEPECGPCNTMLPDVLTWLADTGDHDAIAIISRQPSQAADGVRLVPGLRTRSMLLQKGREVAEQFRIAGTPAAVLLDSRGVVAAPVAYGADAVRHLHLRQQAAAHHGLLLWPAHQK